MKSISCFVPSVSLSARVGVPSQALSGRPVRVISRAPSRPRHHPALVPLACASGGDASITPIIDGEGQVAYSAPYVTGVFGIYDESNTLVFVGRSRDMATSLRRALARRPSLTHGFVVREVSGRAEIKGAMDELVASSGGKVSGMDGGPEQALWESPVDVRSGSVVLHDEEKEAVKETEPSELQKILRKIARRVQADIEQELKARGLKEGLKFAPKMKANGLLDIESVRIAVPQSIGTSTVFVDKE